MPIMYVISSTHLGNGTGVSFDVWRITATRVGHKEKQIVIVVVVVVVIVAVYNNNKPDIIIRDDEKGTCLLIEVQLLETEMWSRKKRRRS